MKPFDKEASRRMRRCLSSMLATYSFFGSLALRLPLTPDEGVENIASNGEVIKYNPKWVRENPADMVRYGIARVVLACALKHHTRRGERDEKAWQTASELVTRPILRDSKLTHEDGGENRAIEQVYVQPPEGGDDGNGGGGGGGGGGMEGVGVIEQSPAAEEEAKDGGTQKAKDALKAVEAEWDEAMHQAHQMSKAAEENTEPGNDSNKIDELIDAAHRTRVDWRTLLQRFMTANAKNDYSWSRPNRRHIDSGLYLPAMHSIAMPPMALMIDTSGSLDEAALGVIWASIRDVAAEVNPDELYVVQCDCEVQSVRRYDPSCLPVRLEVTGRGGTDFRPAFEALDKLPLPACAIYFTDLECHGYPDRAPDYDVMWAVVGELDDRWKPPFGEVLRVDL